MAAELAWLVAAVSVVPVAVALKSCVAPRNTVAVSGVTVALTSEAGGGGGEVDEDEELEPPSHPQTPIATAITSAVALE